MRALVAFVSVTVLLLTGCSSSDGGTPTPVVTATADDTTEPAPEPTDAESTQPEQQQPSISIVSLPIGGSSVDDLHPNCYSVSLTDTSLPADTTIELGSATFKPEGVFAADQQSCPGDLPACTGVRWTADQHDTCYVGVRQLVSSGSTTLQVPGQATCESQSDCDSLLGRSGSQIVLTALPAETPSGG
ncbi:hypothetical protein EV645_5861 [Kribbella rubisoli]|uniref:LppP/LprE lipoprotein n=1 Tax=Kribbella rubisoli TaxID=3075929 RepID=A0A4Q7WRV1_9ACTN|nr:hypothetical protein [Kribbella rubisoli]RZU12588.1 hypothetical protein EV645_5861 [Kribbella rubisoli]